MSKLVKNLLVDDLKKRLDKVEDIFVVSLGRLDAQKTSDLRKTLRQKKIHLQLVKNSLARRATLDTPLAPAFEKTEGMLAIAWGAGDAVDLAKELDRLTGVKDYEGFQCRGGAMEGERLDAEGVKRVAKGPNKAEQLSILSGQISSLGSTLSSQILSAGGTLAGQISSLVDTLEQGPGAESAAP